MDQLKTPGQGNISLPRNSDEQANLIDVEKMLKINLFIII